MTGRPRRAVIEDAAVVFASERRIPSGYGDCSLWTAMTIAILRSLTIELGSDARAAHFEAG
jgi:hypothetical protein